MKIKKKNIPLRIFEISLIILLFQHYVFPSKLTSVTLLLTMISGMGLFVKDKKIYINCYFVSFMMFCILTGILTVAGWGEGNVRTRFLLISAECISSFFIYNYLMRIDDIEWFMKIFVAVSVLSLLAILYFVGPKNAISTRLGHNLSGARISYYIGSTPIYKSSNATANMCAIGILFSLYFVEQYKKYIYMIPVLFLGCGVGLCGSRKGILAVVIFVLYVFLFMNPGLTKKKYVLTFTIPLIVYLVIFKVPVGYKVIGSRMESMLLNFINLSNDLDGNSFLMRDYLGNTAGEWILKRPIWGYGFNTFNNSLGYGTESNILQILVEFGLVGLLVYYSFLPSLVVRIIQDSGKNRLIGIFSVLMIVILIQDIGGVTYSWQHITMWFFVFFSVVNKFHSKVKDRVLA